MPSSCASKLPLFTNLLVEQNIQAHSVVSVFCSLWLATAMAERALAAEVPADANAHCPGTSSETAGKSAACAGCPNQEICATAPKGPDPDLVAIEQRMRNIKHKILVLSGKGGVGKSTFSAQLAFALAARSREVGLLDIDICGPSIPKMLGLEGEEIHQSNAGWSPVYVEDNLGVMSIGFMLQNPDDAVIWRGPRKNALIKQFLKDVDWGNIDYLVVDAPPGTSDEHISIAQFLKASNVDGAIIVTTPQEVSIIDVRKEINFCKKVGIPVLGVVENMSGLSQQLDKFKFFRPGPDGSQQDVTDQVMQHLPAELQSCIAQTEVFHATKGGAQQMASDMQVPFLGRVPLDPLLSRAAEEGRSAFGSQGGSGDNSTKGLGKQFMPSLPALQAIIAQLMQLTEGVDHHHSSAHAVQNGQNGLSH